MPTRRDDDRPIMWTTGLNRDNVIVLSDRAVYVATAKAKDFRNIDVGLDEGEDPEELLGKYRKIPLRRVLRFEYRRSKMFPINTLTLYHDDGGAERKQRLTFAQPDHRDAFAEALDERLGGWPSSEADRHPAITLLKYVALLALVMVLTGLIVLFELMGWIDAGPAPLILCLDFCGVWGILAVGAVFFLLVLAIGIRELFDPVRIITHEPDDAA